MGVVYKARDEHLDRFVAIKVLPREKGADPERKRRFVLEAKSASALNHPNIITIFDIASDDATDFIANGVCARQSAQSPYSPSRIPSSTAYQDFNSKRVKHRKPRGSLRGPFPISFGRCRMQPRNGGMILSVDNIGIGVTNLGRSVEFYQHLGFAKAFENERGCTMVAGSAKLFLFVGAPGREPVARQAFELSLNPAGIDHVSFLVDNVDKTHTELVGRGIQFHAQPADQSWGARAAMLRDPDGTNIYLLSWLSK